eukprot:UN11241
MQNVSPLFPDEYQQLFLYIAKEERRKARMKGKKKQAKKLDFESLLRDADADEEEVHTATSTRTQCAGAIQIQTSMDGEVIDLLDKSLT